MGQWLNRTGRPILYSCSWPAYQGAPNYASIAKHCNIWRNYNDIDDSWDSVQSIIEFYGQDKGGFVEVAGPGNFNDPDMASDSLIRCVHLLDAQILLTCNIEEFPRVSFLQLFILLFISLS